MSLVLLVGARAGRVEEECSTDREAEHREGVRGGTKDGLCGHEMRPAQKSTINYRAGRRARTGARRREL